MIILRQNLFSSDDDKKRKDGKKKLRKSNTGLAGAIIATPITGGGSLSGYFAGKKAGEKADEEGADDYEIIERAKKRGRGVGAATGAAVPAVILGARHIAKKKGPSPLGYAIVSAGGAALGAIGGGRHAKRNIRRRVEERRAYGEED